MKRLSRAIASTIDSFFSLAVLVVGAWTFGTALQSASDVVVVETIIHSQLIPTVMASDITHKDIFLSQVVHETNAFRSKVFKQCNNLCGMKYTKNRNHSYGWCNGHAGYNPINGNKYLASVRDYEQWQKTYYHSYLKKYFPHMYTNLGNAEPPDKIYYDFLVRAGYAEDKKYITKVKKWKRLLTTGKGLEYLKKK